MAETTATEYGALLDEGEQERHCHEFLGDAYHADQRDALAGSLMAALREEVDARLPEGVSWQPRTSGLLRPVDAPAPTRPEVEEILAAAWEAVEARLPEIERQMFGSLPATVEELEAALRAIGEPVHRARVAGVLADAATARMAARVRAEAIFLATRDRSREEVAEMLGTGLAAVAKAVKVHNAGAR